MCLSDGLETCPKVDLTSHTVTPGEAPPAPRPEEEKQVKKMDALTYRHTHAGTINTLLFIHLQVYVQRYNLTNVSCPV